MDRGHTRLTQARCPFADQAVVLHRSLVVSRRLLPTRPIDLSGIEDEVGRLCAALVDLPTREAEPLNTALTSLLALIEVVIEECRSLHSSEAIDGTG